MLHRPHLLLSCCQPLKLLLTQQHIQLCRSTELQPTAIITTITATLLLILLANRQRCICRSTLRRCIAHRGRHCPGIDGYSL